MNRLPPDLADDLAQEALANLWDQGRPTKQQAHDEVRRLAQDERQRRRREAKRLRAAPGRPKKWTPTLCPRLAALGEASSRPDEFKRTLLAAATAIARYPGVLRGDQFRLFHLAFVEEQDVDEMVRILGQSRRAVQKRLRRLSRCLERGLLARAQPHISPDMRLRLLGLLNGPGAESTERRILVTADAAALSDIMHAALEAVIHKGPGPSVS